MSRDTTRQLTVTVSAVAMTIGTLFGIGVFGTRVEESAGGGLAATATLLAPAGPAFSIWSLIYVGLFCYVVWQWLPHNRESARERSIGWLAAASMVLNAAWLLVTQFGWLWASVAVIAALVVVLGVLVRRLTEVQSTSTVETIVVDGTFGLYLGWVAVATVANITATLVDSGIDPVGILSEILAVVVLVVTAAIGVLLATQLGGRLAVAAAMVWGLLWITVGRLTTQPHSPATGIAAAVAAAIVAAAAVLIKARNPQVASQR